MTQTILVTDTPVDLVASLTLTATKSYTLEVVRSAAADVRMFEGGAVAPARNYYHSIGPADRIGITVTAGRKIWVWCANGEQAQAVVTEAD